MFFRSFLVLVKLCKQVSFTDRRQFHACALLESIDLDMNLEQS